MASLLAIDEALARVLEHARPLPPTRLPVGSAAGRVLAEAARAAVDLPPFASSAMDGYAVRAADTPGRLPVVARIAAGSPAPRALAAGEAMTIATGGVVPAGADAVVPVEATDRGEEAVEIREPAAAGAHVRPRAGDVVAGDVLVPAGTTLGLAHVGALAAAGVATVSCATPTGVVVSTGSELRAAGSELRVGEVYEANGVMLAGALRSGGADVSRCEVVADETELHLETLRRALDDADVVVTSGGVSVGPHDLVRSVWRELGVDEVFWGVAVKPGKPVAFGVRDRTLVFGLPGNPVSSLVCFELFVRPALLALQGATDPGPAYERGTLSRTLSRNPARDELVRARVAFGDVGPLLEPVTGQESHMIARAAGADALVRIDSGAGEIEAGTPVPYLRLR